MLSNTSHWWNVEWAPTPEEWQAFWGFLALFAAVAAAWFALSQLREMKVANVAASNAAEDAANASRAATRPYLDVRFEFLPSIPGNPKSSPTAGFTLVVIENNGRSAAKNIRLKTDQPFQSSGIGRQGNEDRALNWIREKFSGNYVFEHLGPGKKLSYVLDLTREQMSEEGNLPQRYEVSASYWDNNEIEEYAETHVLDAEPWHLSRIDADPLAVIARQMRTMNDYERTAQRSRQRLVNVVESIADTMEGDDEGDTQNILNPSEVS